MSDEHEPSAPAAEGGIQHEVGSRTAVEALINPGNAAAAGKAPYNVVDYGAKGDGITNDTPAINLAIAAANTGGIGGIVLFPPGTYIITATLPIYSNIVYQGSGINATIIKLTSNSDMFAGGTSVSEINSFSFQQMTLEGNNIGQNGINVYGFGYTIFNVVVRNFTQKGITSSHDPKDDQDPDKPEPDAMEAMIVTTKVHTCAGGEIYWNGPHDSMFTNVIVYNYSPSSESSTIGIETTSWGTGLVAVGCHVWGKSHAYAWKLGGQGTLTGCQGEGASNTQLVILANDSQVIGGSFYAAGGNTQVFGIQIGTEVPSEPGVPVPGVAGTVIQTKIIGCLAGAVNFVNDGGLGVIQPLVYQGKATPPNVGSAFVNTPANSNVIGLALHGGAPNGVIDPKAPNACDPFTYLPGILALGNYVTANGSPGNLANKFPVYNSSGNLLGYVPVYE